MIKKILYLAIIWQTMPTTVYAENIDIYGRLEVEFATISNQGTATKRVIKDFGASLLGFRARETLAKGLSAVATVEINLEDTAEINANFEYRESNLKLISSQYGTIGLGRFPSPYKIAGGVRIDPLNGTALEARGNGAMSGGSNRILGHIKYISDAIYYKTPSWSGFFINLAIQQNEDTTGSGNDGDFSLAFNYFNGPIKVWLTYAADRNGLSADEKALKLASQAGLGRHTLGLQWEKIKNAQYSTGAGSRDILSKIADATGSANSKGNIMFASYQFKSGNNSFIIQYGKTDSSGLNGNQTDYTALGIKHHFSKRTHIYVGYRESDNSKDINNEEVFSLGLSKSF